MAIRESVERVLGGYSLAAQEAFTGHSLAGFIRRDFADTVRTSAGDPDQFIFKGSAGQGNWARGPWVGIYDPVVTTGAQRGYYPCYLFREDMRGVYLSLNQGMTEAKEHYKADAKTALRARARNFLAMLGALPARFDAGPIDLAPVSPQNDTAFYEAGNICSVFYAAGALPTEDVFVDDLKVVLRLYSALIQSEAGSDTSLDSEGDVPANAKTEDATRLRIHKRIERNASLAKDVKKHKGHTCEVCSINFEKSYGPLGAGYIEAHHLKPLSTLKGTKVALDPVRDFAVLCANCHRMVHRSGLVDDIEAFKREHYLG